MRLPSTPKHIQLLTLTATINFPKGHHKYPENNPTPYNIH